MVLDRHRLRIPVGDPVSQTEHVAEHRDQPPGRHQLLGRGGAGVGPHRDGIGQGHGERPLHEDAPGGVVHGVELGDLGPALIDDGSHLGGGHGGIGAAGGASS